MSIPEATQTRRVILVAGYDAQRRLAAARTIARENRWPCLDGATLSAALTRHVLGDATGDPLNTDSLTYRNIVAPAQMDGLVQTMWAQVDADVPGVVLSAPFVSELANPDWLNDLNYDLALRGYEATVAYVLSAGESEPALDPEHYFIDAYRDIEDLFTAATHLAIELR